MTWVVASMVVVSAALALLFVINLFIAPVHMEQDKDAVIAERDKTINRLSAQLGRISGNPSLGTPIKREQLSNEAREMLRWVVRGYFECQRDDRSAPIAVADTGMRFCDPKRPETAHRYVSALDEMVRIGIAYEDPVAKRLWLNAVGWTLVKEELTSEWDSFPSAVRDITSAERNLLQRLQWRMFNAQLVEEETRQLRAFSGDLLQWGDDGQPRLSLLSVRYLHVREILDRTDVSTDQVVKLI